MDSTPEPDWRSQPDWGTLTREELGRVEQAIVLWESRKHGIGEVLAAEELCDDPKLLPFLRERIDQLTRAHRNLAGKRVDDIPERVGPFRILRQISQGYSCDVYEAIQDEPERAVALKVMHVVGGDSQVAHRFHRELAILANLDHPSIAKVFLSGESVDRGRPSLYFAMEWIDGPTLTRHADLYDLSVQARVELFLRVCGAVNHMHQRGFIHRDLKPSNILTTSEGQPKVLDFGIASLAAPEEQPTQPTVGTPAYMSPEQFDADQQQDVRGDVYSLGVILYQLLSGELPYVHTADNMARAAMAVTSGQLIPLRARVPEIPSDLAAITHQCLRLEPDRRYQSVDGLADDLSNFLLGKPVTARPLSVAERAGRWIVNNRKVAAALLIAVTGFAAAGIVSFALWRRAVGVTESLADTIGELTASQQAIETARSALSEEVLLRRRSAMNGMLARCDSQWLAAPDLVRQWLVDPEMIGIAPRGFGWRIQMHRARRTVKYWQAHQLATSDVSYAAQGKRLITIGCDDMVKAWDLASGALCWSTEVDIDLSGRCVVSPAEAHVLVINREGAIVMLDANDGRRLRTVRSPAGKYSDVAYSPQGDWVVGWGKGKDVSVWDASLATPPIRIVAGAKSVSFADIDRDSQVLRTVTSGGMLEQWDLSSGERTGSDRVMGIRADHIAISADFRHLAAAQTYARLFVVDRLSGTTPIEAQAAGERFSDLQFTLDGNCLLSANRRRVEARSEDLAWGKRWYRQLPAELTGTIDVSPSGKHYAFGLDNGHAEHCLLESSPIGEVVASDLRLPRAFAMAKGNGPIAVVGQSLSLVDPISGDHEAIWENEAPCTDVAWAGREGWFIAMGKERRVIRRDPDSGRLLPFQTFDRAVRKLALDRQRRLLYAADAGGSVHVSSIDGGKVSRKFQAHSSPLTAIAVSPQTGHLATGCESGEVAIWEADGRLLHRRAAHTSDVQDIAFTNDGGALASASRDRSIQLFDTETMSIRRSIHLHRERVLAIAFSPDGQTLAAAGRDVEISICDAITGELQATLTGHADVVHALEFDADGEALYSLSRDGTLRRWIPRPGTDVAHPDATPDR